MAKSKLIYCKCCGAEIARSAKVCPRCGAKNKKSGWRIALGTIFIFMALGVFSLRMAGAGAKPEETISMAEFNSIQTGMTYEQVVKIIGTDGELSSSVDMFDENEYKTELYVWKGNGVVGSNATVTFQGGKVVAKSQVGLE